MTSATATMNPCEYLMPDLENHIKSINKLLSQKEEDSTIYSGTYYKKLSGKFEKHKDKLEIFLKNRPEKPVFDIEKEYDAALYTYTNRFKILNKKLTILEAILSITKRAEQPEKKTQNNSQLHEFKKMADEFKKLKFGELEDAENEDGYFNVAETRPINPFCVPKPPEEPWAVSAICAVSDTESTISTVSNKCVIS